MQDGWIKIHREILEWEWWDDANTFRLFMYCLLRANHEDKKWRGIVVPAGSFITSIENLAKATGLTQMQVRTAMKKLITTNEINKQTTSQYTQISVLKWKQYQSEQQTNNKQITTNKKDLYKYKSKKGDARTLPDYLDKKTFNDFVKMRTGMKAKMTDRAIELFLGRCEKFHNKGFNVNKMIERSILKGWKDIYEKEEDTQHAKTSSYNSRSGTATKQSTTETVVDIIAKVDSGEI